MEKSKYLFFLIFIKFICVTPLVYPDSPQPKSANESQLKSESDDLTNITSDAREYEIDNIPEIKNIDSTQPSKFQIIAIKVGIFLYIQYFQIKRKIGYLTRAIRGRLLTTKKQSAAIT